jgi:hypothetical protein
MQSLPQHARTAALPARGVERMRLASAAPTSTGRHRAPIVHRLRRAALRTVLTLIPVLAAAGTAFAVDAEPSGIAEDTQAKIARARAKAGGAGLPKNNRPSDTHHDTGSAGGGAPGLPNCGVNIGNSVGAPRGQAPREIIVVVKGDVVNANNKCK